MEVLASHFQALVKAAVLSQTIKRYTWESQGRHSALPFLWLQMLARAQGSPWTLPMALPTLILGM